MTAAIPTAPAAPASDYDAILQEAEHLHQLGVGLITVIPVELPADKYPSKNDPAKPAFTGKNPSRWDRNGEPQLLSHSRIPTVGQTFGAVKLAQELGKPIGLAVVAADSLVVIDFDLKDYGGDQDHLFDEVFRLLQERPELRQTRIETTPGGGVHIYVRVADRMASWSYGSGKRRCLFTTTEGGPHRGEVLSGTRISVTAPTRNGRGPYEVLHQEHAYEVVEVPDLAALGIFPVAGGAPQRGAGAIQAELPRPQVQRQEGQTIPRLEDLLGRKAQEILRGGRPYSEDRSGNLAGFLRELYDWVNFLAAEGLSTDGSPEQLIAAAVAALGIEDKAERVADTIDPSTCTHRDPQKALARYQRYAGQSSRAVAAAGASPCAEVSRDESATGGIPPAPGGAQETGSPIDRWEAAIRAALDPEHPSHERNSIRRQINAATLAGELGLRVSPAQARQRILQIQRAMVTGERAKGTAGGEKARIVEKEWLVDGLIARGCLTGIAAFNKVGKTKMAARLAADLIFGRSFLGRFPVAPGPHRIVLWWVDQPAADSAAYLRAVGLMDPDGTLHPQIVRLYTEEDDLAWDDAGADLLLEHAAAEPGLVLITDSFFHSIQRIYGSDQEPEAGGALIDVQTLLAPYGVTHVCLFHSPKDTGPIGIQAIRGHGSAGGAVSACISLHFMEKRCPMKKVWIADKENPHRRMVVEGRAPFQDLLIRGDFERGTFEVVGDYQKAVAELLVDEMQAEKVEGLTEEQRRVLEALGGINQPKGAAVRQIASAVHGTDPCTRAQTELIRKQCKAMVRRGLLRETDSCGMSLFAIRPSAHTE